ncbi:hypothetical protein EGW08_012843 [Elysia chlorotica]|uniref:DUF6451 domain-containing protein n=1 Tax=Elysia chlorotica TaxID=188477 RepID=A0A3S1HHD0_ELYCH|nr:hypothetical protein EGW08_012843 [Elysia chlorotica]
MRRPCESAKERGVSSCSNWRGIMLLSIPDVPFMTRIMLERLKITLNKRLLDEQAGFRQHLFCTDNIASSSSSPGVADPPWTFMRHLEDLDFADDISLLKTTRRTREAISCGRKIREHWTPDKYRKKQPIRINNSQTGPLQLHQENIKEVDTFVYLGRVVSKDGVTSTDIRCRISKARYAFNTLGPTWRSTALSVRNTIRIFNTNVKSVLLYGSGTWRVAKTNSHKLQSFTNRCLRNILHVIWPEVENCGAERRKLPSRRKSGSANEGG